MHGGNADGLHLHGEQQRRTVRAAAESDVHMLNGLQKAAIVQSARNRVEELSFNR